MMLGIARRRIWAPEWKYITKPPGPHPQILFQIHIELEDHRFGSGKKKKKTEFRLKTENSHAWSIHEPTNEYG